VDWRVDLKIHPFEHVPFRVVQFVDNDWGRLATNGSFIEIFFEVEEPATLTHVGVHVEDDITFSVGGIPGDFLTTLEGISGSGVADGVVKATTALWTPANSDGQTIKWLPLLATYSAQRGERLCLKTVKISGGGSLFASRVLGARFGAGSFPWQRWFTGSGTLVAADAPIFGYRSATRRYGFPIGLIQKTDVNAPGQAGMRFFFSDEIAQNAVLSHITWLGRPNVAPGGTYDVVVYDDAGLELSRVTQRVDHGVQAMSGAIGGREFSSTVYLEDAPTIEFGREYFVVLEPASGTQQLVVSGWKCNDASDAAALGGEGEFYYASRAGSSGSFTTDTTVRPMIDLGFFDWGISAPPLIGFHLKILPRYNDNALIEHADDQVVDPRETVEGEPHEAPGFPIGDAIKSYGGWATVEVFRDPEGVFDASTRIIPEQPIEDVKLVNWDPFVAGASHLVFRFRAAEGSATFVDVDQYARLL
jgi:hypothetical protein